MASAWLASTRAVAATAVGGGGSISFRGAILVVTATMRM